jgi:endonuclease/exonuclease/phosphatase family metal-dependent hydrolase
MTDEYMKEEFYQQLSETITTLQKRNAIIVMREINAKFGPNNEGLEHVTGSRHEIGNMNENGNYELCASHNLIIGGTVFPYTTYHKESWVSPDNITENKINHIAISKRFRRSLLVVRNRRGADIGSDHHLMIANFRFKLLAIRKKNEIRRKKHNAQKLQTPSLKESLG